MRTRTSSFLLAATTGCASALLLSASAFAGSVTFKDPAGDDKGPGAYVYPTKPAYKKGDFDLTSVEIKEKGSKVEVTLTVKSKIRDVWDSTKWPTPGNGFSVQMFQLYVDTDGKKGSGHTETLPGMNAQFAEGSEWEKVLVVSPQSNKRLTSEIKQKAAKLRKDIVLPTKVTVRGKQVVATFKKKDIGGKIDKAGWQVLVGSNEGYPAKTDFLSRKVNEFEGGDRFGGGADDDSDPHFLDCLAGKGKGDASEADAQYKMLKFDGGKKATLTMVRP